MVCQKSSIRYSCIEGIPFIIRFKTRATEDGYFLLELRIEGIPFIIRFKTSRYHQY